MWNSMNVFARSSENLHPHTPTAEGPAPLPGRTFCSCDNSYECITIDSRRGRERAHVSAFRSRNARNSSLSLIRDEKNEALPVTSVCLEKVSERTALMKR